MAVLLGPQAALAAGPPLVKATWVTGVSTKGALLHAEIDPNELSTGYRFEYITEVDYQANLAASREGFFGAETTPEGAKISEPLEVLRLLNGQLKPATAYRYRAVATNLAGTDKGPEHSLLTKDAEGESFSLPDGRVWEMVSPVDKGGGAIAAPEALFGGGDIQAAAAPASPSAPIATYGAGTAFGDAESAPPGSQYLSRRSPAGWGTENVSTPLDSAAYGDQPDGTPYRVFSTDLSHALLFGGFPCRGELAGCLAPNPPLPGTGAPAGYMAYYLRDSATGTLSSLLRLADVEHSALAPPALEVSFAAASPDLGHVVLSSCASLTGDSSEVPGPPGRCDPAATNLYEWSAGGLRAVNLLPGATTTSPGASIAAPNGAVSSDGSRVYWTQGGDLFLREGAQTVQVDEAQGGGGTFQTATPDGAVAFFTKGGHLYRFLAATKAATDITPAGGVVGVLGASAGGDYVYYQDGTALRQWHDGALATVASGALAAAPSDYPPATGTARVSDDGTHLLFLSSVELTGYDNLDAQTKQPDAEVYLYRSPAAGGGSLTCVSCNPSGERPRGPSTIPDVQANGSTKAYKPRVLTAGGGRVFFDSEDALVAHDTNSRPDVYQWEASGIGGCVRVPGCISLISSGRSPTGARFLDATAAGSDVFFLTEESLVNADPGSVDVYDARIGGGFAEAPQPIACVGDACQALPSPPDDPSPGTLTPSSGNPPKKFFGPKRSKQAKEQQRRKRRKHRHREREKSRGKHQGVRAR